MQNKFGIEIQTGDIIGYSVREGSCGCGIHVAKVVGWNGNNPKVVTVNDRWGLRPLTLSRALTISIPSRIITLRSTDISWEYLKLLDTVEPERAQEKEARS
jgi:hypothetical protein